MSKEELLKYLIAEIDLIMHDKDYRFENDDGTWYSRESCRDLTNKEVFEELKTELRELANLETKLAESQHESQEFISKYRYWRGECAELNKQLAEKDTKLHEYIRCALEDYNDNQKEIIELKQQLAEKDKEIENVKKWWAYQYEGNTERKDQDKISFAVEQLEKVKKYCRQEAYHDSYGDYMIVYERRYYEDDEEKTPNDDLMGFLDNQIEELKKEMK